ncbi:MAG: HAD family phosphatase [Ruthenibacterium sp.]
MEIQAALFDMDGLMFDTERLSGALWIKYAPSFGLQLTLKDMELMRGRNAADGRAAFLEHFGADAPFDALRIAMRAEFEEQLKDEMPILPGLPELLAFLKARNIPMAVVSSTRKELVQQHLEVAGIAHYFDALICGDMVEHSKPNPDIYWLAAKTLHVAPEACLVLEDSYNGVRAGHAAGCYTVMVPNMDPPTPKMEELASAIVPSLFDIPALLDA